MSRYWFVLILLITSCGTGNETESQAPALSEAEAATKFGAPTGPFLMGLQNPEFPLRKWAKVIDDAPNPAFTFTHRAYGGAYRHVEQMIANVLPSSKSGRLTVIGYFDCNPCRQPRRPEWLFPRKLLPDLDNDEFNEGLERRSPRVMTELRSEALIMKGYMPIVEGVKYKVQASVEDRFTDESHRVMRQILTETFADRPDVEIGRNGGSVNVPYPYERHDFHVSRLGDLKRGDIINMDGENWNHPGDNCRENPVGYDEAKDVVREARRRGIISIAWRPEWHGLTFCKPYSSVLITPDKRKYRIVGKAYIKELLRGDADDTSAVSP